MMLKEGHVLVYIRSEEDNDGNQELLVLFTDPNPVSGGALQRKTIRGNLTVLASQWSAAGNILCVTNDIRKPEDIKPKEEIKSKPKAKRKPKK